MSKIPTRVAVPIFIGIVVLTVLLGFLLARRMPLRYFAWFGLLTAAYMAVEQVVARAFAEKMEQSRYFKILVELVLGIIFVTAFTLFAVYIYPG